MSDETKFTPGPWHFRLEAVRTVIFHKAEIGEKAIAVGAGSYPDHIANARLIAAAPELYETASDYLDAASAIISSLLDSADLDDMDRIAVNKWSHAEQKLEATLSRARTAEVE